MKNFFKKLSFVLAIAMVLTSLAPATASAASKNYVKANGKKVSATYAYIGGKEVVLTPYVNGKKATKVTIENSNPEKATIDKNGVVTPVANGNTIVTFKKGDKKIGSVTVKVRTRAKALNIYDRAEYKAGNKTKLTELTLKVGDKKDLQITMPLYKASKKAGAVKASYFTYAEVDGSAVKVTKNAGQRNFTVEAVEAGTAKVTIVANQKTQKNVRDKYYVEASFDVTVKDEKLEAKQTGNKVITVKGVDLTDKAADYKVLRGKVALTPTVAFVKEGDNTAVTLTFASKLGKNTYSVAFKEGEAVTVDTEDEEIANIEFLYDAVIADTVATSTGVVSTAAVYYKVTNQFEEDITSSLTAGTNATFDLMISGGPASNVTVDKKTGKISFDVPAGSGIVGVSQFTFTIVSTKTGKNATKTFTLSKQAEITEINILGSYKATTAGLVEADLVKGDSTNKYFILIEAKDQYGRATTDASDLNVPANGFFTVTTAAVQKLNNVNYIAYPVDSITVAGKANVVAICTKNGKTASKEVTVLNPVQIKTFTAKPVDNELYNGVPAEFTFEAIDSEGNAVTSYAELKAAMRYNEELPAGFKWDRQADGSAKLYYTPAATIDTTNTNLKDYTMVALTFKTPLYGFDTITVKVNEQPQVRAITGLSADAVTGAVEGRTIVIKANSFTYADQYENPIAVDKVVGKSIVVVSSKAIGFADVSDATVAVAAKDTTILSETTTKAGSMTVKFYIQGIENSDYDVKLTATALKNITDVEVKTANALYKASTSSSIAVPVVVTAKVDGVKVNLTAGEDFAVVANASTPGSVTIPQVKDLSLGLVEDKVSYTVRVFGVDKDYTAEVKYSNAAAVLTTVGVLKKADAVTHTSVASGVSVAAANLIGATVSDNAQGTATASQLLYALDQYSTLYNVVDEKDSVRYNVSVLDADVDGDGNKVTVTIAKNNTALVTATPVGAAGQKYILHVEYTFKNGLTTAADILYVIEP